MKQRFLEDLGQSGSLGVSTMRLKPHCEAMLVELKAGLANLASRCYYGKAIDYDARIILFGLPIQKP